MYIFGYFFQKGHILRAIHKKVHINKKLWRGGGRQPPCLLCSRGPDFFSYYSRHETQRQFTMFDSISCYITEIKKYFTVHDKRKSVM